MPAPVRKVASDERRGMISTTTTSWVVALLRTTRSPGQAVLRVTLAAVIFPHGAQHLLGWFGGYGFSGTIGWMGSIGIPAPLGALAIVVEFLAPLCLVIGLGARVAAAGIAGVMVGAAMTHLDQGFFMNWFGTMPAGAEGFEYHLLALAMAIAIVVGGAGSLSLDRTLARRR